MRSGCFAPHLIREVLDIEEGEVFEPDQPLSALILTYLGGNDEGPEVRSWLYDLAVGELSSDLADTTTKGANTFFSRLQRVLEQGVSPPLTHMAMA